MAIIHQYIYRTWCISNPSSYISALQTSTREQSLVFREQLCIHPMWQ